MAESNIELSGREFIEKLLAGERDFTGIRLEPYFNLSGDENFEALCSYLQDQDLATEPVILEGADLRGIDADGVYLPYVRANGAHFKHATLMEANLEYAELRSVDFRYARLPQTKMKGADLRDADMRQADLNLGVLTETKLKGCNVAGAHLLFTNMQGADITDIMNLIHGRSVDTANFQFVSLSDKEKQAIRMELWAQQGKKRRLFGGAG